MPRWYGDADRFTTTVAPCQFGGNPDCLNCGCIASAGLEAIGRHKIKGVIPVGQIFYASVAVGRAVAGFNIPPLKDF